MGYAARVKLGRARRGRGAEDGDWLPGVFPPAAHRLPGMASGTGTFGMPLTVKAAAPGAPPGCTPGRHARKNRTLQGIEAASIRSRVQSRGQAEGSAGGGG